MKRHNIYDVLTNHAFTKQLILNIEPIVKCHADGFVKYVKDTGKLRADKPLPLVSDERYHADTFYRNNAIINTTERMANCLVMLQRFPSPQLYSKHGIGHHTWLEYHLGYYIVLLVSLNDTALILVNTVFQLGNSVTNCKPDIIKSNGYIKGTPTKTALDSIDKLLKPYRSLRNVHVHRGQAPDLPELFNSNDLDLYMLASALSLMSEGIIPQQYLNMTFRENVDKILERLNGELDELQSTLSTLFDSLLPVYERHAAFFSRKK